MEKKRVKRGEKYWFIYDRLEMYFSIEDESPISDKHFKTNNYFHTREEAESAAKKVRIVLADANVIQMPSEEEVCNQCQREWATNDRIIEDKQIFNDIVLTAYSVIKDKIVK